MKQPVSTIITGANGSGKMTFAIPYTNQIGVQFINADELTKVYEKRGEPNAMMKGGREFFKLLNQALSNKEDVCIETTLFGTYTTYVMRKARKLGYTVKMVYIFLENAQQCVDRVAIRVAKKGHHVPEEDIRRRFYRSIDNFRNNFMEELDVWYLYYNGGTTRQLVAIKTQDEISLSDSDRFHYLQNINTDDAI